MKRIFLSVVIVSLLVFNSSCKSTAKTQKKAIVNTNKATNYNHYTQAILWQQNAAEYRALCHQAYNTAKSNLAYYKGKQFKRPLAVVTDIDETVLDNSPYNARMILSGNGYTRESWLAWGKELKAKAIPGALDFFKEAYQQGITIFYVSNRYDIQKEETIANLKKLGFPGVDENHVLLRKETSSKEPRRKAIERTHQIIMLFGDNLTDFSEEFEKQPTEKRNALVEQMKDLFGKKYIVLPNPIYGDWETKGIFEGSYKWTPKQKDSIRKAKLRLN